jgi:hypothetical protein
VPANYCPERAEGEACNSKGDDVCATAEQAVIEHQTKSFFHLFKSTVNWSILVMSLLWEGCALRSKASFSAGEYADRQTSSIIDSSWHQK